MVEEIEVVAKECEVALHQRTTTLRDTIDTRCKAEWIGKHPAANHHPIDARVGCHQCHAMRPIANIAINSEQRLRRNRIAQRHDIINQLIVRRYLAHLLLGA